MSEFENSASGWTEEWDEAYQCYFFYNASTGESSWERPEGLAESEDAKELNSLMASKDSDNVEKEIIDSNVDLTPDLAEEAADWIVAWDENYEAEFFINKVTGESSWEKPAALVALQSGAVTEVESTSGMDAARSDPANWCVEWDSSYGCEFYFNKVTEESSWEKPTCLEEIETLKEPSSEIKDEKEQEKVEQQDGQEEKTLSETDQMTDTVAKLSIQKGASRKNSIMRRPSARPELAVLRNASIFGPNNPPPPPPRLSSSVTGDSAPTSKRRQSLAPRPSLPPPKPIVIRDEFRSQISSIFGNIKVENDGGNESMYKDVIIEGDENEDIDDDEDNGIDEDSKLQRAQVMNDLTSFLDGSSSRSICSDTEPKKPKPRALGAYMLKRSPAMLKSWQKRYVVLKSGKLSYYGSKEEYDNDKPPKGEINLMQVDASDLDKSAYLVGSKKVEIHIRVNGDETCDKKSKASKDRVLMLQAFDQEGAQSWLDIAREWISYVNA